MPFIWGRYYTDEELRQIAEEMNKIGKTMEDVHSWSKDVEERRKASPNEMAF